MKFEAKTIPLKDGRTAVLQSPRPEDAAGLIDFIKTSSGETEFLARYPEEWDFLTIEKEEAWAKRFAEAPDALAISAYIDGRVVGNAEITFRGGIKTGHRAVIAIAILRDYWGLGIGSAMFEGLLAAAKEKGTMLVELEYMEGNERGRRLYEKFGFRIVAEKPNAYRLRDGSMRKEYYMQKYL